MTLPETRAPTARVVHENVEAAERRERVFRESRLPATLAVPGSSLRGRGVPVSVPFRSPAEPHGKGSPHAERDDPNRRALEGHATNGGSLARCGFR